MSFRRFSLSIVVASVALAACAGQGRRDDTPELARSTAHATRTAPYDVEHYAIDLLVRPEARAIEARCRIRLWPRADALDAVELDLVGLAVRDVRDGEGRLLSFTHEDGVLAVALAETLRAGEYVELDVAYGGTPVDGLWFAGDGPVPNQVWTQGEAEHSRGWFPCFDHPSDRVTSEVRVTMPAGWISVAAGDRIDRVEEGALVTEHWSMNDPHPCYLVTLVAGEFEVREAEWDGVPLWFVAEAKYADWLDASFHLTDEVLTFLSDYTGLRYPYSKYSQACVDNFPWGGMENITATTLTPLTLDDELGNRDQESHGLVAHEAAHQWFGDLLTCNDWSEIWLNESFATYMTWLFFEHHEGEDSFRTRLRDGQEAYAREAAEDGARPIVWNVYAEPEDLFDSHAYPGGAARLHLLRALLGDDVFRDGVRTYVAENANRSVTTDDLRRALEKVSGRDLGEFFDAWVHAAGHPIFDLDWKWNERDGTVRVDVAQLQTPTGRVPSVFPTEVTIEIRDAGGVATHRVSIDARRERFELPAKREPIYVLFDPRSDVPKTMRWKKSGAEWAAIASRAEHVNARRDAVRALGALADEVRPSSRDTFAYYVAELGRRVAEDPNARVRADAAEALGLARGPEARARLVRAARSDPDARVRTEALTGLAGFGPDTELARFGREQFAEPYSWAAAAAAAGLVVAADPDGAYAFLTEALLVDSPHDQLKGMLFAHLAKIEGEAAEAQLVAWMLDDSLEPSARGRAARALAERERLADETLDALASLLSTDQFRLRRSVVETLRDVGGTRARAALAGFYPSATTSGERRAIEAALAR